MMNACRADGFLLFPGVLRSLVEASSSGVSVLSLCEKGDAMIMEETGKIFKKEKEMKESIAFPTSISINNCVCHFSPLKNDQDSRKVTW